MKLNERGISVSRSPNPLAGASSGGPSPIRGIGKSRMSGYTGGQITSADTAFSRIVQRVNEDEEEMEEIDNITYEAIEDAYHVAIANRNFMLSESCGEITINESFSNIFRRFGSAPLGRKIYDIVSSVVGAIPGVGDIAMALKAGSVDLIFFAKANYKLSSLIQEKIDYDVNSSLGEYNIFALDDYEFDRVCAMIYHLSEDDRQSIIEQFDKVLQAFKSFMISIIGASDAFIGQTGIFANFAIAEMPVDIFLANMLEDYADFMNKIKNSNNKLGKAFEKTIAIISNFVGMPLKLFFDDPVSFANKLNVFYYTLMKREDSLEDLDPSILKRIADFRKSKPIEKIDKSKYLTKKYDKKGLAKSFLDKASDAVKGLFREGDDLEDEEDDLEEYSVVGSIGGGPVTPLGTGPSGKPNSKNREKDRIKKANIYK